MRWTCMRRIRSLKREKLKRMQQMMNLRMSLKVCFFLCFGSLFAFWCSFEKGWVVRSSFYLLMIAFGRIFALEGDQLLFSMMLWSGRRLILRGDSRSCFCRGCCCSMELWRLKREIVVAIVGSLMVSKGMREKMIAWLGRFASWGDRCCRKVLKKYW